MAADSHGSSAAQPSADKGVYTAQENAVGISVYARQQQPGFHCIVKQRFTDFLVNEILPNGEVLHLGVDSNATTNGRKRRRVDGDDAHDAEHVPEAKKTDVRPVNSSLSIGDAKLDMNGESTDATATTTTTSADKTSIATIKATAIASIPEEDKAMLDNIFGKQTRAAILSLYAAVCAFPHRKPRDQATIISEPILEKSKRTEAHMCIRRIFDNKLETLTVPDQTGASTIISVKTASGKAAPRPDGGQRGKQDWVDLGGEYLHFTLYKENKDTMEVLHYLATQLKLNIKHLSFAGTKDRRGVTVQRVAIHRVKRERMELLNKFARGWRLSGPWQYKSNGLELGMLAGNEFLITLRDVRMKAVERHQPTEKRVEAARSIIEIAARDLARNGFINYYGLQRFGTHTIGTHTVGMKMLKGDFKGAVDAILTYNSALADMDPDEAFNENMANGKVPRDDILRAKAIHALTTGQPHRELTECLRSLGSRFSAEKGIVTHLAKYDHKSDKRPNANDFVGALRQIQRNLRLLYVHAYQSFVWNSVAAERWKAHGDKVIEGDLVVVGEKEAGTDSRDAATSPQSKVDQDGEPIVLPSASANGGADDVTGFPATSDEDPFVRARPLSKDEAGSGRYTIFDVVLPLPGFDVVYPANETGKFYESFMASNEGGGLDPHDMRRGWKDISLSGGYRKMMGRPLGSGVEVELKVYRHNDEQMVQTDLEALLAQPEVKSSNGESKPESTDQEAVGEEKIAVLLKMQLSTSQYATMALRELTKGGAASFLPDYNTQHR